MTTNHAIVEMMSSQSASVTASAAVAAQERLNFACSAANVWSNIDFDATYETIADKNVTLAQLKDMWKPDYAQGEPVRTLDPHHEVKKEG